MSTYEVVVTREGSNWLADVPAVPGAHSFARSLTALAEAVREVVVLMDDLEDDASPEMTWRFDGVESPAVRTAAEVGERRRCLHEMEARVQAETRMAVEELARAGYSVRDASALLDITPGRVSQLLNA